MKKLPHHLMAATLAITLAGSLAACGDDDASGPKASGNETTTTVAAGAPGGLDPKACDAFADLTAAFAGDPSAAGPAGKALAAAAPAEMTAPVEVLNAAFAKAASDPEALGSPEFSKAWATVGDAVFDGCDTEASIEVKGVDYSFSGIEATVPAGRVAVRFTNASEHEEPHELVLMKRKDGVDDAVADLMKLPQDQVMSKVDMAGVVFVDQPGGRSTALFELEAGKYIAICMIPTAGNEADPHASHGMIHEFEVK